MVIRFVVCVGKFSSDISIDEEHEYRNNEWKTHSELKN